MSKNLVFHCKSVSIRCSLTACGGGVAGNAAIRADLETILRLSLPCNAVHVTAVAGEQHMLR